jgi:integrase-like protein
MKVRFNRTKGSDLSRRGAPSRCPRDKCPRDDRGTEAVGDVEDHFGDLADLESRIPANSSVREGRIHYLSLPLHGLRHFMATQMLDAGVPIPIVAARLCHARASTTLNVYAHAVPGGDRLAAEALWRRVDKARRVERSEADDPLHSQEASSRNRT